MIKKALFLMFSSFSVLVSCNQNSMEAENEIPFACSHPTYITIENGMGKADILNLLGLATSQITRGIEPDHSVFKSDLEKQEFWLYELDQKAWEGTLEVYFDAQEKVVGKNCGWG